MKAWIENIESTVKEKMSTLKGSVHSFEHVKRVYEMATWSLILEIEQAS